MSKQDKVIFFSHENDIDGLGCVILGKIAFKDIDYVLSSSVYTLEEKFRWYLENDLFNQYDRVFITDLALRNPSLEMVSKDFILSKKVLIFDHHISSINEGLNIYSFTKIIEEDENGKKRCGTDLLYDYLCRSGLLSKTKSLDEFVELTRLEDTWQWKKAGVQGLKAHDVAILFNELGIEKYINNMVLKLIKNDNSFEFDSNEKSIIMNKKRQYIATLKRIWSEAEFFEDELNNKYAGLYADYEYRNELAEYVRSLNDKELKYLILIALEKGAYGQKSYRSIASEFDVSKIAETHGGGGHKEAASVNITKEQKEKALILRKKNYRDSIKYLIDSSYY